MRALVVYCHPDPGSFTAAVRDLICARLTEAGADLRVLDLYARGFDGALSRDEWRGYLDSPANRLPVAEDVAALEWCDTLIFVYPTWWYGLPAVLKGWLDRVMLPDVAFLMPDGDIRPNCCLSFSWNFFSWSVNLIRSAFKSNDTVAKIP